MIASGPTPGPSWAARFGWLAFAAVALWLVWGWRYETAASAEDPLVIGHPHELAQLPPEQEFVIEGRVEPLDAAAPQWKGRVVWMRTERERRGGTQWTTRIREEHRPAIAVVSGANRWVLPEGSYDLRLAPKIPDDPWYDWSQGNRGFKAGDVVVARGRIDEDGHPAVQQLAAGPLAHHTRSTQMGGAARFMVINFARVIISVLIVAVIWSALMRTRTTRILLRLMAENAEEPLRRGR